MRGRTTPGFALAQKTGRRREPDDGRAVGVMGDLAWTKAERPPATGFDLLRIRAANYWRLGRRIAADSLWRFRRKIGWLTLVTGVALAMQVAALGLFVAYARRLESQAEITVLGVTVDPTGSFALLVAAIGAGGVMLIAASFLRLYVDRGFYEIGAQYGVHCAERMIALTSAALHGMGAGARIDPAQLKTLAVGGSRVCSRALYGLMGLLPLAGGLAVYSVFLLYLDPLLTAVILLIVLVSAVFYYGLSLEAAKLLKARQERQREMADAYARMVDVLRHAPRPIFHGGARSDAFANFFAQFFRPKVVQAASTHVGTVTQAAVLIVVGLVKGGEIIATGTGFGELVVFLLASRLAMTSFQGLVGSMVMLNRFYPRLTEYFDAAERLERARDENAAFEMAPGQTFRIAAKALGDDAPERAPVIGPGARLGLVTPRPVDRFALLEIVRGLKRSNGEGGKSAGRLAPGACWLVAETPLKGPASFAEAAGLPPEMDRAALARELSGLGFPEAAVAALPGDLNAPLGDAAYDRIDASVLWGAGFAAAVRARHPVVVAGLEALEAIGEAARTVLARLSDRVIVIAGRPTRAAGLAAYGADYALLYDGKSLLGYLGAAELAAKPEVLESIPAAPKEPVSAVSEDDLEEEM